MKKVRLLVEVYIDENEVASIVDHTNDYKEGMTFEEYANGLDGTYTHGKWGISNPIEDYFNENIGNSNVIKGINIIEKTITD